MERKITARQLEDATERIKKRLSGKKPLFPVTLLPEHNIVEWEGEDIDDFLELCELSSSGMTYICEYRATKADAEEDDVFSNHIGELYLLKVAFLQDGYFHQFKEAADWYESYWERREEQMFIAEQSEVIINEKQAAVIGARISKLKIGEIAEEFINELEDPDHPNVAFEDLFYDFLRKKYDWPPSHLIDLRRVNVEGYQTIKNLSAAMEKKVVERLLPVFVEWAGKNNLKKIPKADTELFLSERCLKLSKDSVLTLWRKGVIGMKEWQDNERKERQRELARMPERGKSSLDDP